MLSEAEYLDLQAKRAKARFLQTANTLGNELLAPFELRPLIQRRPWWSLAGAAVVGFASGRGLRRRGRKAGPARAAGPVAATLAMITRRARRMLSSLLGAVIARNLRPPSPPPTTTNGRSAAHHAKVS